MCHFDWPSTERGSIQRGWQFRPLGSRQGEVPRSPSRSLQDTDVDRHSSPATKFVPGSQYEVAGEVADVGDPVRDPHCTIPATSRTTQTATSQGPEAGDASTDPQACDVVMQLVLQEIFSHGIGQPGENHERIEIVHPPPPEEGRWRRTNSRPVHQMFTRTVAGLVVCQRQ